MPYVSVPSIHSFRSPNTWEPYFFLIVSIFCLFQNVKYLKSCSMRLFQFSFMHLVNMQLKFFNSFFLFFFLEPHPRHMDVPRLGVKSELQLPAYTIATAMPNPSCVYDLHHSSQQQWILTQSKARDWTCILTDTGWVRYHWATMGVFPFFISLMVRSFLALNNIPLSRGTTVIYLFIYWRVCWLLPSLAIMNETAINITMQILVWT